MAKVFFSYSHKDEGARNELEKHLAILKREGAIETWHDRRIPVGADLDNVIDQNLIESNLCLLLVSPDFLASEYCYSMEMKKALEMRQQHATWVIPIILDHCDWQNTPLGGLLACPTDGKPVSDYPNPNRAFNEITHAIRDVIRSIASAESTKGASEPERMPDTSAAVSEPRITEVARSGNLRIKKEFSDYDRDTFKKSAFEYMVKFFRNSLQELSSRNTGIRFSFEKEANKFSATLYRGGKEIAACLVINRAGSSSWRGITYSFDRSESSINSSLDVEDDGYSLFLVPMFNMTGASTRLSEEGAAEFYWAMLVEHLQ